MNFKVAIAAFAVLALGGIFTTASCGGDVCTKAADQLTACVVAGAMSVSGSPMAPACSGSIECNATCINQATCDQLVNAFSGMADPVKSKPFLDCTSKCAAPKP